MIPQNEAKGPKKLNMVADVRMKIADNSEKIEGYTYWEVLRFKLFTCCNKKSPRYLEYKKHLEIIEERMDIVNFVSNEGYASLLSKLLMKPYQLKMTSHLESSNQISANKKEEISMQKAVLILTEKQKENAETGLEHRMNQTLVKTLESQSIGLAPVQSASEIIEEGNLN